MRYRYLQSSECLPTLLLEAWVTLNPMYTPAFHAFWSQCTPFKCGSRCSMCARVMQPISLVQMDHLAPICFLPGLVRTWSVRGVQAS